jgi:quercetin dioxygenase-like cupin family protein
MGPRSSVLASELLSRSTHSRLPENPRHSADAPQLGQAFVLLLLSAMPRVRQIADGQRQSRARALGPQHKAFYAVEKKGAYMVATTPGYEFGPLADLASRTVDLDAMVWSPTPFAGIKVKTLLKDETTGLLTCIFKWEPGAVLPMHEHVELEQTFVLEGSLVDEDGEVTAGNYVWRPAGSKHVATAPKGALVLCFFLKPNQFM